MEKFQLDAELREFLFFFPIKLNSFINFIIGFLEDGFPKGIGVLLILKKYGPTPISKIGENLAIRKPNMTPIIDELEQKGLVKRCISPEDRRIINIVLTDEGALELERKLQKIEDVINEKCTVLPAEELDKAKRCVRYLIETMDKVVYNQEP